MVTISLKKTQTNKLQPELCKLEGKRVYFHNRFFFCRVLPELNISNLRTEIEAQLDNQEFPVPQEYIFIRNVGRHFAMVSLLEEEKNTGFSYVTPIFANSLIIMSFPPFNVNLKTFNRFT